MDRARQAGDGPQGQGALHAAQAGDHWTFRWPGAFRSIAPPGSGRNSGPTTLTRRSPGGSMGAATGFGLRSRLIVSRSSLPSALASDSGSSAGSGRPAGVGITGSIGSSLLAGSPPTIEKLG